MSVPIYATAMILNYRRAFHDTFERDTMLSDSQIWTICNTIFDDESNKEQDIARVDAMMLAEKGD